MDGTEKTTAGNFIYDIIEKDNADGKYDGRVFTRFPPEPNGYLHIGHVKAICLDFMAARKYGGKCNLRFDDTNPIKENVEYVEAIKNDIEWLGFKWDKLLFASDYFQQMYDYAVQLIKKGLAFVCELTPDQIRDYRGTLTEPGTESPWRGRSIEENLDLFTRMKNGEFPDGAKVLRAKIDMNSPNINMRDPIIYRIAHATHHNTGDKWCIYPMYDFAHPLEDAIEGITHSLCTLEFEDHRPLYNWFLEKLDIPQPPQQIEFARLNITNMIMSKRYLKRLVEEGKVDGWDDPRMSTIAGIRRRGYTPESLRAFSETVGIAKRSSTVDIGLLEYSVREDIKDKVEGRNVILDPVKLVITNYPDSVEYLESENCATDETRGKRMIPFGRELYIERDDFMITPPPKYHRLYPGNEVRLRNAYFVKCVDYITDESGKVIQINCTYDPETKSGSGFCARKVKGTIHWVEASTAISVKVNEYGYLLLPNTETGEYEYNPDSHKIVSAFAEPSLAQALPGERFQFIRKGFYVADSKNHSPEHPEFNLIVPLKTSFDVKKQ